VRRASSDEAAGLLRPSSSSKTKKQKKEKQKKTKEKQKQQKEGLKGQLGYWEATGRLLGGQLGQLGYWEATGRLLGGYWEVRSCSRQANAFHLILLSILM
jgi:hypothetical protein